MLAFAPRLEFGTVFMELPLLEIPFAALATPEPATPGRDIRVDARTLQDTARRLIEAIGMFGRVLVACSGGVDSVLVAYLAQRALPGNMLAVIGVSPSLAARERDQAIQVLEQLSIPHRQLNTHEIEDKAYVANTPNRCYFCKSELFDALAKVAAIENFQVIADGVNAGDLEENRPSMPASRERGIRSPLAEAGLSKAMVRGLARELGLPVWDKPSMPCLASRVPHGTPVTIATLRSIEQAEDVLSALGFRQFRVRHHGDLARIELALEDLSAALAHREAITDGLRLAGYKHVTLDLDGYRQTPSVGFERGL